MALTVVKFKKAQQQQQQQQNSTIIARNNNISVRDNMSAASHQNPVTKVTKSSVQAKIRPANAHIQPLKRSRSNADNPVITPKKIISSTGQAIPIQTIQSISYTTTDGQIIEMPQKISNTGLRVRPRTTFKIAGSTTVTTGGGGSSNKQYTTVPLIQANGVTASTAAALRQQQTLITTTHQQLQHHQNQPQQHQQHLTSGSATSTATVRRPTIYLKGTAPKKTVQNLTMDLIDKSPKLHLGVNYEHLQILKSTVCPLAEIPVVDLYMTLKKLRHNEDFQLLSQYFEYSYCHATAVDDKHDVSGGDNDMSNTNNNSSSASNDIIQVFIRTLCKLAKYLKYLIRWPDNQDYYQRRKNLPIAYRSKLSHVQALIDCVEIEIQPPSATISNVNNDGSGGNNNIINLPADFKSYKFIITMTPSGIITYVSDVCAGNNDDLTVFNACKFHTIVPKYLSLVADPGAVIRRSQKIKTKIMKKVEIKKITASTAATTAASSSSTITATSENNNNSKKNNNNNSNKTNNNNNKNNNKDNEKQNQTTVTNLKNKEISKSKNDEKDNNSRVAVTTATTKSGGGGDGGDKDTDKRITTTPSGGDGGATTTTSENNTADSDDAKKIEELCEIGDDDNNDGDDGNENDDEDDGEIMQMFDKNKAATGDDGGDKRKNNHHQQQQQQIRKFTISPTQLKTFISSSNNTMSLINNKLISNKVSTVKIPTINLHDRNDMCRLQVTQIIHTMKEYKILQPYNSLEPQLYQYLNEILVVISALINLQR